MATTTISMLGVLGSALYLAGHKTQINLNLDIRIGHIIGLIMIGGILYLGYEWNWYYRLQNYITNRREKAREDESKNENNNIKKTEKLMRKFNDPSNEIILPKEENKYLKYFNKSPAPAENNGNSVYTPINANENISLDVLPEDMFPKYYLKYQYRSPEKLAEIVN